MLYHFLYFIILFVFYFHITARNDNTLSHVFLPMFFFEQKKRCLLFTAYGLWVSFYFSYWDWLQNRKTPICAHVRLIPWWWGCSKEMLHVHVHGFICSQCFWMVWFFGSSIVFLDLYIFIYLYFFVKLCFFSFTAKKGIYLAVTVLF